MNGNLGRDKLWNQQIWSDIDKAVQDEAGRIRLAQKVFPSTMFPNTQPVPSGAVDPHKPDPLNIPEAETKPFVEISMGFLLTQSQVDSEEQLHTGRNLAKMAASKVAIAEDSLLFKGTEAIEVLLAAGVKLMSASSVKNGIPGEAFYKDVTGTNGSLEIFNAVVAGISKLNEASEPGPYALLLSSEIYAESFLPLKGTLVTTADRINPLVTGGFYGTGTLKKASGLLVSLGGQSTTIYVGTDAITAFTQTDLSGYYQFRVFERIQYVVRDRKAIVTLKFGK